VPDRQERAIPPPKASYQNVVLLNFPAPKRKCSILIKLLCRPNAKLKAFFFISLYIYLLFIYYVFSFYLIPRLLIFLN